MLAYAIILSTALSGLVGLPWWTIVVGAAGLILVSMSEHLQYRSPWGRAVTAEVMSLSTVASAVNGSIAVSAAFLLGRLSAVVWGI